MNTGCHSETPQQFFQADSHHYKMRLSRIEPQSNNSSVCCPSNNHPDLVLSLSNSGTHQFHKTPGEPKRRLDSLMIGNSLEQTTYFPVEGKMHVLVYLFIINVLQNYQVYHPVIYVLQNYQVYHPVIYHTGLIYVHTFLYEEIQTSKFLLQLIYIIHQQYTNKNFCLFQSLRVYLILQLISINILSTYIYLLMFYCRIISITDCCYLLFK